MTNKTRRYIQYFLEKSGMKNSTRDSIIVLDEREEGQMNSVIKDHRKSLRKRWR